MQSSFSLLFLDRLEGCGAPQPPALKHLEDIGEIWRSHNTAPSLHQRHNSTEQTFPVQLERHRTAVHTGLHAVPVSVVRLCRVHPAR